MRKLSSLVARPVRNDSPVPFVGKRASSSTFGTGGGAASGPLALMGQVGTLFAIVNRTSTAVAALDWDLFRTPTGTEQTDDAQRERINEGKHAALDLWRRPNPFMTTTDLVESGQQHIDLAGETFLIVVKRAKIPIELWPVRPDRMEPRAHPTKFLIGWTYKGPDGEKIPLDLDEVIQIKMPNPNDPYRGLAPVAAILTDLQSSTEAAAYNAAFFRNSAEPGGIVEVDRRLDDTTFAEMTSRWAEQHRGVSNAHRVAILENGAKWIERKYTMRDMQFAELRQVSRDVIMEAYGISRAMLGVTDGVNYAAAKAAKAQFDELLTVPRANRWRQALNVRLLPMFGAPGKGVEFDYESPVEGDDAEANAERDSKVAAVIQLAGAGWDPTDAAKAYGLPEIQYGVKGTDPDRDLMIKLVSAAPAALGPMLLPLILPNVEFPAAPGAEPAPDETIKPEPDGDGRVDGDVGGGDFTLDDPDAPADPAVPGAPVPPANHVRTVVVNNAALSRMEDLDWGLFG